MRLTNKCTICGAVLVEVSSISLGNEELVSYKCGHTFARESTIDKSAILDYTSLDGTKTARQYQKDGIDFIVKSGFNCIIGDQQRLGKTPQSLIALHNYYAEMSPTLILVRSANIYQWIREYKTWVDALPMGIFIIEGTKNWIPPGFSSYIMSMDTFSRPGICKTCGHSASFHKKHGACNHGKKEKCGCVNLVEENSMVQRLLSFGFKLVIVDECHSFKNTDSNRSQALVQFLHNISYQEINQEVPFSCIMCKHMWTEIVKIVITKDTKTISKSAFCPHCHAQCRYTAGKEVIDKVKQCGIVMLSGTPIKNRADEYYVPLNLVAPEKFPSIENLRRSFLIQDDRGRYSRIAPAMMEQFKKTIAPYFLRREKEDVYKDVPKLNRMYTVITIEDDTLKKAYNKVIDEIEIQMVKPNFTFFSTIGELTKLRQICGLAKVDWTANYVETCIEDENGKHPKFAIGVHHHSVRDLLTAKLFNYGVCKLDGTDSPERKDFIAHQYFETSPEQVLVLGMMAAKEGIELVYLDSALVLEREWTSADEEQFEYRFYNPDLGYLKSKGLENKITNIEYILAKGTVDEFMHDLVEEKREVFGETIGTNWNLLQDKQSWKNLVERTISSRL
jgi:SNF2 family DNA or RNA helicase